MVVVLDEDKYFRNFYEVFNICKVIVKEVQNILPVGYLNIDGEVGEDSFVEKDFVKILKSKKVRDLKYLNLLPYSHLNH